MSRLQPPFGMAALAAVLLVSALLFVAVFAMAGLSLLPLRMADQHYQSVQATLMARAAVEQVKYEMLVAEAVQGVAVSMAPSPAINFATRFNGSTPVFTVPGAYATMDGSVGVTFDKTQPYFSTDNSVSGRATAGWIDQGTPNKSIPPSSVDLVITSANRQADLHLEAILSQTWPYAVFSPTGLLATSCLTITGCVGAESNCVKAGACAGLPCPLIVLGSLPCVCPTASPTPIPPAPIVATVNGNANILYCQSRLGQALTSHTSLPCRVQVLCGGQLNGVAQNLESHFSNVKIAFPCKCGASLVVPCTVPGLKMRAWCNTRSVCTKQFTCGLATFCCPYVKALCQGCPSCTPSSTPTTCATSCSTGACPKVRALLKSLVLNGSGGATTYYINDTITNYIAKPLKPGSLPTICPCVPPSSSPSGSATAASLFQPVSNWTYTGASISLNDCVLIINGNLDLISPPKKKCCTAPREPTLSGNNATLIVKGTLRVQAGQLASGPQGLAILAQNVSLEAGGQYNGLILATKIVRVLPLPCQCSLCIQGGVVARGCCLGPGSCWLTKGCACMQHNYALRLVGTCVTYQPQYLTALNGLVAITLKTWRQLP